MPIAWIRIVFALSGVYDAALGLTFLLVPAYVYRVAHVVPPNHFGYVQFPALLLILFGVMFFFIAADPLKRREQMLYGAGLKAAYVGMVLWYVAHGGIPAMWIPWAWADAGMLLLFLWAWSTLRQQPAPAAESGL